MNTKSTHICEKSPMFELHGCSTCENLESPYFVKLKINELDVIIIGMALLKMQKRNVPKSLREKAKRINDDINLQVNKQFGMRRKK